MKRTYFLLAALLFGGLATFFYGCEHVTPLGGGGDPEKNGNISAGFDIPALRDATRAPITGEMISSMWVMVFNENGNYLSRHRGELTPAVEGDLSRYTFRNIPVTTYARTLHFVANYEWSGFDDGDMSGLSENEVVRSMSVAPGTVVYWQRVALPAGALNADPGTTVSLGGTVSLLRNVAEITVANNTATAGNSMSLTEVEFAVGDYPDLGSVAPFNSRTGAFGTGNTTIDTPATDFITEALGIATVDVAAGDFVRAKNPGDEASTSVEVFERRNSTATDQTFVIIKGYFQSESGGTPNTTVPSYYKIDIVDPDGDELLDLQRNHRYRIDLRLVSKAGHGTLEEAVLGVADNNINAAVTVSEYTAVSDGDNVLRIENSSFIYVRTGEPFEFRYSYIDASTGATDNTGVSITLVQNDARPVVAAGSFGYTEESTLWTGNRKGARIWGTTASFLPDNDIYRASINISKGVLSRVVQLQLRPAMNFFEVGTAPANGLVAAELGEPVSISFKMPVDIAPHHFPIPVYITTKRFSPDPSYGQLSVNISGGDYRYVYYAPYLVDADNRPLPHTIHLVSNSPNANEAIALSAEMFNDATVQFANIP